MFFHKSHTPSITDEMSTKRESARFVLLSSRPEDPILHSWCEEFNVIDLYERLRDLSLKPKDLIVASQFNQILLQDLCKEYNFTTSQKVRLLGAIEEAKLIQNSVSLVFLISQPFLLFFFVFCLFFFFGCGVSDCKKTKTKLKTKNKICFVFHSFWRNEPFLFWVYPKAKQRKQKETHKKKTQPFLYEPNWFVFFFVFFCVLFHCEMFLFIFARHATKFETHTHTHTKNLGGKSGKRKRRK